MNFKKICLALVASIIFSCTPDTIETFDHAAQYVTEKPIVDEYLATHYFDDVDKEIKEIDANQTALINDANLQALSTNYNDVDYVMYSYVYEQGQNEDVRDQNGNPRGEDAVVRDVVGSPDRDDLVNVAYKVFSLDGEVYEESKRSDGFLYLDSLIEGWRIGMAVFRGGYSNEDDSEVYREYTETGKGFMIIPSGLAYQNHGSGFIGQNEIIVFKIELRTVISYGEDL
ncbi:hypothetical protein AXE80_02985 [Wenyingzhuangia fucanilytica]|uniref:Peptidyl-prolyl cis-trans isomerase n=1 Tax=Wenyingzhuangia fucanilytica TaxID=1790137 RepID=A0A1B1Y3H5_9FLAO|nr:FKBP-type peptidyl-prolyl cis-trans isomerase [Wenyingzhuangia fucanilytica]ANW95313.1 hypothetical protein AXE80_02985 [Wenyingzhuangia fucanilytica]